MHFAGEGTNAEYFGYVHGAYFSGIDVANTVQQRRVSSGTKLLGSIALVLITAPVT